VTDKGLENLRELSHLKGLSLMGTEVSEDGAKKLREALPNCQVVLDPKNEQGSMPFFRKRPFAKFPKIMAASRFGRESKVQPVPEPKLSRGGFNVLGNGDSRELTANLRNAQALHAEGQTLAADERWEDATVVLGKAAKLAPEDEQIHHHLGIALARSGHVEAALPHFAKSVGEAEAHYNVGVILYEEGQLEASEHQLVQALRLNPNLELAQEQLDDVRMELKAARTVSRSSIRAVTR
jgi:tetratricopeptide (TPR) repeat protein